MFFLQRTTDGRLFQYQNQVPMRSWSKLQLSESVLEMQSALPEQIDSGVMHKIRLAMTSFRIAAGLSIVVIASSHWKCNSAVMDERAWLFRSKNYMSDVQIWKKLSELLKVHKKTMSDYPSVQKSELYQ